MEKPEYKPQVGDTVIVECMVIDVTDAGTYTLAAEITGIVDNPVIKTKHILPVKKRLLRPGDLVRYIVDPQNPVRYYRGRLLAYDTTTLTWIIRDNSSSTTGGRLVERKANDIWHD